MKKQIISVILSIVVMLGASVPVMAAATVTSSAVFDSTKGAIIVSGTVITKRFNQYLTLEIAKPDGSIIYTDDMLLPNAETETKSYSFAPVMFYAGNPTGDYTIKVTVEDIGAAPDVIYYFEGADKQHPALDAVCDALTAKSKSELADALVSNASVLGLDKAAFEALGEDGKTAVINVLLDKEYTLPAGYTSEEDIEILADSVSQLQSDYLAAIAVGEYNDISSVRELEVWLENYGEKISADDVQTTDRDEGKLYEYVLDASKENAYVRRISGKDIILAINDIQDVLYEEALLTILEVRHYTESQKVLEAFPALFALNLTNFRKLSESKRGDVYSDMKGNYESCVLAGTKFNDLVDALLAPSANSSGGNSGGGRNNSGGYTAPVLMPSGSNISQETNESGMPFPDMASAAWANEAVAALKAKGIISGDNNGRFNPNDYVTRAEFAKMMVTLTGAEMTDSDIAFADVNKSDWFYSYVKAAAAKGLVMGDDAGNFNPDAKITREDMAVILYRAYGIDENLGYSLSFSDSGNISEYAKEAIAFLSAKKIINGVGKNMFAPKNNATRAEAAQLIYNALEQIGK